MGFGWKGFARLCCPPGRVLSDLARSSTPAGFLRPAGRCAASLLAALVVKTKKTGDANDVADPIDAVAALMPSRSLTFRFRLRLHAAVHFIGFLFIIIGLFGFDVNDGFGEFGQRLVGFTLLV
jgi:hypothetical protein